MELARATTSSTSINSALDGVDVTQVLKADPNKASSISESLSHWTDHSAKQGDIRGTHRPWVSCLAHGYANYARSTVSVSRRSQNALAFCRRM